MPSYAIIKVKLRAVIGSVEFTDVVSFSSSFAMNTIPQASLQVAMGRNVQDGQLATIHEAIHTLRTQQKAEVFLRTDVTDREDALPGVPFGQELKIFEGKTVGIGYRRTGTTAHFTIHILHWLADINYASAVSASSHPGNPSDLTYPAIFAALGGTSGDPKSFFSLNALEGPAWIPIVSKSLVNQKNLSDIWGKILHPWMNTVSADDPFELHLFGGQVGPKNPSTLEALDRMKGGNPDGVPLDLDLGGANANLVAEGISQALMNETGGNWVNTTLWGKLIGEWAPAYWFSVIPRVTDCLIVPFTGGLRGDPWSIIGDEDYDIGEINSQLTQVLRAVGIVYPVMFMTGIDGGKGAIPLDRGGFAGFFRPDNVTTGMMLVKDPPKWLSDPMILREFTFCAEAVDGEAMGTVLDDAVGDDCALERDLKEDQASQRDILNNFAHQWYVIESLKGRVGEVATKLRFDICPGSNIRLQSGGARNVISDQLREDLYATVYQVTTIIDAEGQKAATGFSLAHIRTTAENAEDGTSVEKPPLYKTPWFGAKMTADGDQIALERLDNL